MITGFNTDIEHEGVTYHVQTEDKGLDTPLILSLVYVGGAILASKRSPYSDLINSGFSEKVLTERLQRQHKLICAAIRAGRIEDLKGMGERDAASRGASNLIGGAAKGGEDIHVPAPESSPGHTPQKSKPPAGDGIKVDADGNTKKVAISSTAAPVEKKAATAAPSASTEPALSKARGESEKTNADALPDGLYLSLLEDHGEFRAGELVTIRVHTSQSKDGRVPAAGASVTVKVLGTTFRPVVLPATTDKEGVAVVRAMLPRFTSGRAAILIRAVADGNEAELRRIIQQA
ncbi:MAG TPA: hypothetical protein VM943_12765 [Pyrinomonadaceae bacterium]|nr:hypothetical protein [Pyrinomonadaceae bacterium]